MTTSNPYNIQIHDAHLAEEGLLFDALRRIRGFQHLQEADVFVTERIPADAPAYKNPGWLEYTLRVKFKDGGSMTIGAIQRSVGAQTEFHS